MFPTQTTIQYHFDGQKPDEKILLVLHRHWFDILSQFILVFFLILLFFGSFGFSFAFFDFFNDPTRRNLFLFGQNSFFLFIWLTFFIIWIDYYFDIWIVTNRRIVNIEQNGLFNRKTSELELEKIQDVTTDVNASADFLLGVLGVVLSVEEVHGVQDYHSRALPHDHAESGECKRNHPHHDACEDGVEDQCKDQRSSTHYVGFVGGDSGVSYCLVYLLFAARLEYVEERKEC